MYIERPSWTSIHNSGKRFTRHEVSPQKSSITVLQICTDFLSVVVGVQALPWASRALCISALTARIEGIGIIVGDPWR